MTDATEKAVDANAANSLQQEGEEKSSAVTIDDCSSETEEERAARLLEEKRAYNRRNSARARKRVKDQMAHLVQQVEGLKEKCGRLEEENQSLNASNKKLRTEVDTYKRLFNAAPTLANQDTATVPQPPAQDFASLMRPSAAPVAAMAHQALQHQQGLLGFQNFSGMYGLQDSQIADYLNRLAPQDSQNGNIVHNSLMQASAAQLAGASLQSPPNPFASHPFQPGGSLNENPENQLLLLSALQAAALNRQNSGGLTDFAENLKKSS